MIPSSVGSLVNLRHLALGHNLLQGNLPLKHQNWTRLEYLDASNNNIWGSIASAISHMESLLFLNLEHNYLSGPVPSSLSNCKRLQVLVLDRNMFSGVLPSAMSTLTSLVRMSMSFNNLTGGLPPGVLTLPHLTSLMLSHNRFFGPSFLEDVSSKRLRSIDVSYNFLQGDIPRGLFSVESTARNCFFNAPKQHSARVCLLFYSRNGISWHGMLPKGGIISGDGGVSMPLKRGEGHRARQHLNIILGCAAGGAFLLAMAGACVLYCGNHNLGEELEADACGDEMASGKLSSLDKELGLASASFVGESFSFNTLHRATGAFSCSQMMASCQSGDFYKGMLDGGVHVVVKRVYTSKMIELCSKELEIYKNASHKRLVTLLGHCLDTDEKLLVYEFMPFGDLESLLLPAEASNERNFSRPEAPLDWVSRLKIAVGVAEGLVHLHHRCSPHIVHGNVKASSILLDEKFEAKLGSLGRAHVEDKHNPKLISCLRPLDEAGQGTGPLVRTKDVHDFGKLLLELLSGKPGMIDSWVEWAVSLIDIRDKETFSALLDPSLIVDGDFLDEALAMAAVAKACLNVKASKRPKMRHVLRALRNPQALFQEKKMQGKLWRMFSQRSWNATALSGSLRSASASENPSEIVLADRTRNSTLLVQNVSYVSEIEEFPPDDILESGYDGP